MDLNHGPTKGVQLKPGKALGTLGRFAINSTAGVIGVFDIAKRRPFRLPRRSIGFADTLGFYGVKAGPFLYLPLIGPTSLRDLIGGAIDGFVLPTLFRKPFNRLSFTLPATVLRKFDSRNEFDEELEKLRQTADPYAASREFYLRKRSTQIDELRGKRGVPLSATSKLTNPALDPLLTPMSQPTAPAPASRHGVMTLPGMSGRKP